MISTAIGITKSWVGAAAAYAVSGTVAAIFYLVGWSEIESDASAVIGGRADELQQIVRLKAAHHGLVTGRRACLVSS